ncbi:Uncharacterized protein APZ42_005814 [Daphnia magna]|uniref:Uncharacterized protein n=1 Tax=Daphnia magna TaxID=35525 RepID=A0A162CSR2_9CRUS|nr:Uncharacterized protein APZ42_005814 [Daphnia magna]
MIPRHLGYDLVWQPCLSIPPISFGCSRRGEGLKKVKKSLLDLFKCVRHCNWHEFVTPSLLNLIIEHQMDNWCATDKSLISYASC